MDPLSCHTQATQTVTVSTRWKCEIIALDAGASLKAAPVMGLRDTGTYTSTESVSRGYGPTRTPISAYHRL